MCEEYLVGGVLATPLSVRVELRVESTRSDAFQFPSNSASREGEVGSAKVKAIYVLTFDQSKATYVFELRDSIEIQTQNS